MSELLKKNLKPGLIVFAVIVGIALIAAAAMAHYAKMRGDSQEAANQAAEIKVRAEAALGALDREARPGNVGQGGNRMSSASEPIPVLSVGKETHAEGAGRAVRQAWRNSGD